jgi:hypothetical protein
VIDDGSRDGGQDRLKTSPRRGVVVSALLILMLTLASGLSVPKAMAHGPRTWIAIYPSIDQPGVDAHYFRQPAHFHEVDADSEIRFTSLHWRGWGSRTAVATGRARACGEGGIEGRVCESGRVRLVAGNLATCSLSGESFYQHLVAIHPPLYGSLEIPVAPESLSCGPP